MDYYSFNAVNQRIFESGVLFADLYLRNKSETWIRAHLLNIGYEKEVYDFIVANCAAIHITEDIAIYNVTGQWQLITKIEPHGNSTNT